MSCHSCGPGSADRRKAKELAKEMTEKIKNNRVSDLRKKLGIKKWGLQNITFWRERRFITVAELAEMAGVSPSTVRRIEAGLVIPGDRLTAAAKIQRAINKYPVRDDPRGLCCSGLWGMIDRGWIKVRKGTGMLDPDRTYFLIEIRGTTTNLILGRCPSCGEDLYPAPDGKEGNGE